MAGPSKKLTNNENTKIASHEIEESARENVFHKVCDHGHLENTFLVLKVSMTSTRSQLGPPIHHPAPTKRDAWLTSGKFFSNKLTHQKEKKSRYTYAFHDTQFYEPH